MNVEYVSQFYVSVEKIYVSFTWNNSLQAAQFLILVLVTPCIDIRLLGYEFEMNKVVKKLQRKLPLVCLVLLKHFF